MRREPLSHLGIRHGCEVEHGVGGEQIEVRHCLIRTGNEKIDLFGLAFEQRTVSSELLRIGNSRAVYSVLETERQPLDAAKSPRDARREQGIDERKGMRHRGPPLARSAGEAMLNPRPIGQRHQRCRVVECRRDRWIPRQ